MEISRQTLNFKKSMQFLSLHVKGFSAAHTSDDDIAAFFRAFGDVRNVKMTQTGAALVSFSDREAARRARDSSNGAFLNGYPLEVSLFEPKELRVLHQMN